MQERIVVFLDKVESDKFTIFGLSGGSGASTPKETGISKGKIWLTTDYIKSNDKWIGKFIGFWTPQR
jgi:hypothetical protein